MKKWIMPKGEVEKFTVNDCVAACITGTLQCQYPGDGKTNGQEVFDDYKGQKIGWWYEDTQDHTSWGGKMPHGRCGLNQVVTFNNNNATAKESNGAVDYDIQGYLLQTGTYTGVTWKSKDGDTVYHHRGRLIITNIDNDHPNHS